MEVIQKVVDYKSRSDVFKVHPIGDIHLGTKHCAEDKIKSRIQQIKNDPLALWIGMGDYGEFISAKDPRHDGKVVADWVDPNEISESEIEHIVDLFRPIKSQCIGLLEGNHEDAFRKHQDGDPQKQICKRLGLINLGYSAFIRLVFRRGGVAGREFLGVVSHGSGCAITRGAKVTRLERFMDNFDARWYAHGHVHDIITSNKHYMELTDADKIRSLEKVAAMTGCWFTGYTQGIAPSYGEIKNYPPTALGAPIFMFDPMENKVWVTG
jgi:hypothetical protein